VTDLPQQRRLARGAKKIASVPPAAVSLWSRRGVPAAAFPKPDRPVADIVSPIWHDFLGLNVPVGLQCPGENRLRRTDNNRLP
jgi:hypothetical protein